MGWFLCEKDLIHERLKGKFRVLLEISNGSIQPGSYVTNWFLKLNHVYWCGHSKKIGCYDYSTLGITAAKVIYIKKVYFNLQQYAIKMLLTFFYVFNIFVIVLKIIASYSK